MFFSPLFYFKEVPGFITEEINMNSACMSSVKCNINPHSAKYGINLLVSSLFFFFSLFEELHIDFFFFFSVSRLIKNFKLHRSSCICLQ